MTTRVTKVNKTKDLIAQEKSKTKKKEKEPESSLDESVDENTELTPDQKRKLKSRKRFLKIRREMARDLMSKSRDRIFRLGSVKRVIQDYLDKDLGLKGVRVSKKTRVLISYAAEQFALRLIAGAVKENAYRRNALSTKIDIRKGKVRETNFGGSVQGSDVVKSLESLCTTTGFFPSDINSLVAQYNRFKVEA